MFRKEASPLPLKTSDRHAMLTVLLSVGKTVAVKVAGTRSNKQKRGKTIKRSAGKLILLLTDREAGIHTGYSFWRRRVMCLEK